MKRRVVITGMGAISPIGNDIDEMVKNAMSGVCGIDEITKFDTSDFRTKLAGELKNLDMEAHFPKKELRNNDDFTNYAKIVAKMCMEDAKLEDFDRDRAGVIFSSGIGGLKSIEETAINLHENGVKKLSPFFIVKSLINISAGQIAIDHKFNGMVSSIVTACAASNSAIGDGFRAIRDGYLDYALVGGSEASITRMGIGGFEAMKALSFETDKTKACIPFDKNRNGFVMGEGAGIMLLEELESAKKRGAKIYAEVVGYGTSCDAFHVTAPQDDGKIVAKALKNALDDANLKPEDIDYISVHGTSTKLNDLTETKAIREVFPREVKISSLKSYLGHLLGASSVVEGILAIKGMQSNTIFPTITTKEIDEECYPNVLEIENKELKYIMKNSLGFGGHNVSIIYKKWEE